jgi:hypothetical protein
MIINDIVLVLIIRKVKFFLFFIYAITFYEGNNMLSALVKYVINRLIHGLFHIALVISPRLISTIKVSC